MSLKWDPPPRTTCGTRDVSHFIKTKQPNYASHIIRTSYIRLLKQLMLNDDVHQKETVTDRTGHP